MTTSTTSFAFADGALPDVVRTLVGLGFRSELPQAVTLTLLDTFDGRLQRAGLRLVLHDSDGGLLVLVGDDSAEEHRTVSACPSFRADLPASSFRSPLSPVSELRALLPQMKIAAMRTTFVKRSNDGSPNAAAHLYSSIAIVGVDAPSVPTTTVEVTQVLGHPKPARRAIAALTALGIEPFRGDTLALVATAAGIDAAGFSAPPTCALDPNMAAVEGFRLVLANLAEKIARNRDGTIHHTDPEFLHDLRIAVRRTRTVLAEGNNVLPADISTTAHERFAGIGALTGPARDLDAFLIEWDRYTHPLGAAAAAALEPARELLEQRQAEAHKDLDAALQSPATTQWDATWRHLLTDLSNVESQSGKDADRPLGRVIAKRITRAQQRLIKHGRAIGPDSPATQLHDLRKDAKKLRYLLECFASILPDRPQARFVKRLKALQENLGQHQDAEVHVTLIRDVATVLHERGAPSDTLVATSQLAEQLDQLRVAARAKFADRFAAYDTAKTQSSLETIVNSIRR